MHQQGQVVVSRDRPALWNLQLPYNLQDTCTKCHSQHHSIHPIAESTSWDLQLTQAHHTRTKRQTQRHDMHNMAESMSRDLQLPHNLQDTCTTSHSQRHRMHPMTESPSWDLQLPHVLQDTCTKWQSQCRRMHPIAGSTWDLRVPHNLHKHMDSIAESACDSVPVSDASCKRSNSTSDIQLPNQCNYFACQASSRSTITINVMLHGQQEAGTPLGTKQGSCD
jgi:hypothetical protein